MDQKTNIEHDKKTYQIELRDPAAGPPDAIYKMGDTIPWEPNPKTPGWGLDGVYDLDGDGYLIIKDCKLMEIVPVDEDWGKWEDETQSDHLEREHATCYPRDLWSEEAWKALKEAMGEVARSMMRSAPRMFSLFCQAM